MKKLLITIPYKTTGAVTMVTVLIILFLITLVIFISANINLMETKTHANNYRTTQAFLSAQAGINAALSTLSKANVSNDLSLDNVKLTFKENEQSIVTGQYHYVVTEHPNNQPEKAYIEVAATGLSGDGTAEATIKQRMVFAKAVRDDIDKFLVAPIIASGDLEIDVKKILYQDGLKYLKARAWSGGVISGPGIVNSTQTGQLQMLVDKLFDNDPDTINPLSHMFYKQLRDPNNTGSNTNIGIKQMSQLLNCKTTCTNPASITGDSGLAKMHYVVGPLTLSGSSSTNSKKSTTQIGTKTNPVILIVDNGEKFQLKNEIEIYGLIYIEGNWNNHNNSAKVNGAVIINGHLTGGIALEINYHSETLKNIKRVGVYTRLPSSWIDI